MEARTSLGGESDHQFAGSSLEQHVLRHLVRQQRQGRSLVQVLGDAAPESMRRQCQDASIVPSAVVTKLGKFVPYEPYSACVATITSTTSVPTSTAAHTAAASISCPKPDQLSCTCSCKTRGGQEQQQQQVIRSLQMEVKRLAEDKEKLLHQLQLANQVSDELKRLVVASMGEDIESRLSLITEDKARMAEMVRDFSDTVARQYDSHESLAIKCDVLRSKYTAYSLMVEELSHWKSVLSNRNQQSEQIISTLLSELNAVSNNITQSLRVCDRLECVQCPTTTTTDNEAVSSDRQLLTTVTASHQLHQQLLELQAAAPLQIGTISGDGSSYSLVPSEAEKSARQLLETSVSSEYRAGWQRHAANISSRFHPNANFDRLTLNCCKNCSGQVYVV